MLPFNGQIEEIERAIHFLMADPLDAHVGPISYDTTSLRFEVDEEYGSLLRRGRAKNGRDDSPRMVVGLAVARDGPPLWPWLSSGNTSAVATVK